MPVYAVFCKPDGGWSVGKSNTDQAYWNEHTKYINELLSKGRILLGGTYADYTRILMVLEADDEESVRMILNNDPLIKNQITMVESIVEWMIYFNRTSSNLAPE